MSTPETVEVKDYNIERTSEKAILISRDNREYWIPKSQIIDYSGSEEMPDTVIIPGWLADKKGLIPQGVDTSIACYDSPQEARVAEEARADAQSDLFDDYASMMDSEV